jgi:tetratricopeptide (TPR) repeat protein
VGIAYQRGILLCNQKRYALAADEFRKELEQIPNSAQSLALLAMALTYDKKLDQARAAAESAIAADAENGWGHFAMANVIYKSITLNPRPVPLGINQAGARALERKIQLTNAAKCVMESIRLFPRNVSFLEMMAAIELDRGRVRESMDWLDQVLAIQPNHAHCLGLRARALANLGRNLEARQTVKDALAVNPNDPHVHAHGGWAHLRVGDAQEAAKHFEESVRLNPNDPSNHRGLKLAADSLAKRAAPSVGFAGVLVSLIIYAIRAGAQLPNDPANPLAQYAVAIAVFFITVICVFTFFRRRRSKR